MEESVTSTLYDVMESGNQSEGSGSVVVYEPFRVGLIIILMKLTLIGNVTLISIITCHAKLRRKRVNVFLVNLAVGDLMVCFVVMTTEILFVAFGEWVLGALSCKLIVYGQIVTLASTTFLLTAMSVDRYQVIVKPLKSLTGNPTIWRKVAIAWLLALIFATPQLFIFVQTDEGLKDDGNMKHNCASRGYTAPWQRKLYFSFLTAYILIIPTTIMSFCYINIIKVVWMRCDASGEARQPKLRCTFTKRPTEDSSTTDDATTTIAAYSERLMHRRSATTTGPNRFTLPKKLVHASRRKVIKMTLSVIVGFVLCWLPYFVVSLVRIYSEYRIRLPGWLSFSEIMAMAHSALNPILYGIFSTQTVKRDCRQLCCLLCRPRLQSNHDTVLSEDETLALWKEQALRAASLRNNSVSTRNGVASLPKSTKPGVSWRRILTMGRCVECCCKPTAATNSGTTVSGKPFIVYRHCLRSKENSSSAAEEGLRLKALFKSRGSMSGCLGSRANTRGQCTSLTNASLVVVRSQVRGQFRVEVSDQAMTSNGDVHNGHASVMHVPDCEHSTSRPCDLATSDGDSVTSGNEGANRVTHCDITVEPGPGDVTTNGGETHEEEVEKRDAGPESVRTSVNTNHVHSALNAKTVPANSDVIASLGSDHGDAIENQSADDAMEYVSSL